ncbi:hypothetical protein QWY22_13505 [Planococcus liqunii]|nr:hypothetical protein [Planococcus sp. N056]WKA49915.1 hypothetical protein QWY22_13505 [Planococcus sp. N056]
MMKMQKGICVESKGDRFIYLTGDGQFLAGRAVQQTRIGEEGYFYEESRKAKINWQPIWIPAMAAFAVLFLFISVLLPSDEAFAYVQVEINPGVELGLDEDYRVISIRDLNDDGENLIGRLGEWKNHSLDEVLGKVIALSITDSTEEVIITTVDDGGKAKKPVEQVVTAVAASAATSNIDVHLKKATLKQWRESIKESVPVGQKIDNYTPVTPTQQGPTQEERKQPHKSSKEKKESGIEDEKAVSPKEHKKESVPARKADDTPIELPKKAAPQEPKKKEIPPGQEKKITPMEPKKKENPAVPKKKSVPPGQEKKQAPQEPKEKPVEQERKATPLEPKTKKTPPGLEKKATPPKQEKKATPKAQEKKQQNQSGQTKKDKKPPQKKGNQNASKKENPQTGQTAEKKKAEPKKKKSKREE